MNVRDDFFYQAVLYAKEKNYSAARAMLRNLLFQYPDDIEGLLLYSIVAKNREGSIQALKRILRIDPDHEIAFARLTKLKHAPPSSIPSPTVPLHPPSSVVKPVSVSTEKISEETVQRKPLEARLKHAPPSSITTPTAPLPIRAPIENPASLRKAPEEVTPEPSTRIEPKNKLAGKKGRKKRPTFDIVLIGLLIITCLCVSFAGIQAIYIFFVSGL